MDEISPRRPHDPARRSRTARRCRSGWVWYKLPHKQKPDANLISSDNVGAFSLDSEP